MKKILFIFGTRPEAIKMVSPINVFKKESFFDTKILVSAQHREMLDQILDAFEIKPDFDLNLMSKNQSLEQLTSKILKQTSSILDSVNPDLILVQGDTTTTFASSLSAFYKKIPVAHIEAGLRTKNIFSPFPEEINRRMTSNIAKYHFPPTADSAKNLLKEGIEKKFIKITGNTVIDSLLQSSEKVEKEKDFFINYYKKYKIDFSNKRTILVTGHRRENFGSRFENICNAILHISKNKNIQIIYPVHLNPHVQEPVQRILKNIKNVHLIPPQDYLPFIFLMKKSYLILTDSGGVQEEAPSLGKPVLVMRSNTERPEGVKMGTALLVGTDYKNIIESVDTLINNKDIYDKIARTSNPYGDGNSSIIILNQIKKWLHI